MLSLCALVGLISSCSSTHPVVTSLDPVANAPEGFAGSGIAGSYEPIQWWATFADPVLDRVIDEVLASNYDLAAATARVEQARMLARIAGATLFPVLQPTASGVEFDSPTNAGIGAQFEELGLEAPLQNIAGIALPERLGLSTYSLGMEFAYEVDFWGRNRNDARAAGASQLASESDYQSALLGVLAETVGTYLEIVHLRGQQRLTDEIIQGLEQLEAFVLMGYNRGLHDVRAVHAARRNLREAQAELPQIQAQRADAEARLWILMGGYRDDLAGILPDSLTPAASLAPVPPGIVADLLVQRPDINAARQRLEAARYTVGARRADFYPRLSLQGSIGLQSTDLDDWFDVDQWFRNLSANLLGPVLQRNRLRNESARAEARLDEAVAFFGHSVVTAVNEVEATLAGLDASQRRHALVASMAEEATAESALVEARYAAGLTGYDDLLVTRQMLHEAQSQLVTAARDLGYARLALHRALGGDWTTDEETDTQQ